jgi:RHS repeat-associated protein
LNVVSQVCDEDHYHYGFNGKLKDNEWAGLGNHLDYGMRHQDTRTGRFNSVDPLTKKYPELTPYQFASNRPIQCKDLDGLEAYFDNSGTFVKYGPDVSKTAPVILVSNSNELKTGLTMQDFSTRVYMMTGEGSSGVASAYYAHTIKNAKSYGYHGKGFTESKMLDVLWQDKTYSHDDFLKGIPKNVNGYAPYKKAFPVLNNPAEWNSTMKENAKAVLEAETGISTDPTRGATNWGGGIRNYNFYANKFGEDNIITITDGTSRSNFYNLNTGVLSSDASSEIPPLIAAPKTSSENVDIKPYDPVSVPDSK